VSDQGVLHTRGKTYGKVPELLMHDLTVTDGAKITYAHMHWRFSQTGQNFESQSGMAKYLGVSEAAIGNRIKELEAKDWVVVISRAQDPKSKKHQAPIYHVFEHQGQCRQFRDRYTCQDGESLRAKTTDARERKSRKGAGRKGGNPLIQPNSGLDGIRPNSGLHGNQPNSGLDNVLLSDSGDVSNNNTAREYTAIKDKWESVVRSGMPTPNDLVGIQRDIQAYGHKWCMDALNGVKPGRPHTWNYIHSILEAWKKDGKPGEVGRVKYITEAMTVTEARRLEILMGTYTGVPQ
jgi:hypothetical protein